MGQKLTEQQLRQLLDNLPIRLLKRLGRGKLDGVSMTSKRDIIGAIVSKINESEIDVCINIHKQIIKELEPKTICWVPFANGRSASEIQSILSRHSFKQDEKGEYITENGFDSDGIEVSKQTVKSTYWYSSVKETLNANYELEVDKKDVNIRVGFDIETKLIDINGAGGAVSSALSFIRQIGIDYSSPTVLSASSSDLEQKFKDLINHISKSCNSQNSLNPSNAIEIRSMKFFYPQGGIREKSFHGREDIFSHPDVRKEIDGNGAKILHIGGRLTYRDLDFDFRVGFVRLISGGYVGEIHINERGSGVGDSNIKEEIVGLFVGEFLTVFDDCFDYRRGSNDRL